MKLIARHPILTALVAFFLYAMFVVPSLLMMESAAQDSWLDGLLRSVHGGDYFWRSEQYESDGHQAANVATGQPFLDCHQEARRRATTLSRTGDRTGCPNFLTSTLGR